MTFGDKSVYTLKLRGVDSRRIALLVDGIPVCEPYSSTFDLKTVSADGIDSLKLTKGPSSVLYGPNTLGGIVNVITQRPAGKPALSLHASYGELNTRSLGLRSGFHLGRCAFSGSLQYQDSDGYYIPDEEAGERLERTNTDYQRANLNGKLYFNPSNNTEILLNAGIHLSDYGMPPDTVASRPRFWRFKKWNRYSFNAGGYTALDEKSIIRYRAFYVQHDNVLDMFMDRELTQRSMYSDFSGNPDLLSERGTIWELGFTYNEHFLLSGAVFLTRFKDLIDSVRLPEYDFERIYFNIGKARIDGFELQWQKAAPKAALTLNYTYLDHWNQSDDQPLTVLSKHNLNFDFQVFPMPNFRLALLGLLASSSSWLDIDTNELLEIPSYFNLDVVAAYRWKRVELFLKVTNVFDKFIYTELGFPWRGRYFEVGFKADFFIRREKMSASD